MPQSNISTWLSFALQQMAAESYLDDLSQLLNRLKLGNNNIPGTDPNTPILPGKTRFSDLQAEQFAQRYHIVDHHANDATGFSATLLKDTTTNTYTLSFRSLEYQNQAQGGDWERDGQGGAAGEIAGAGFALGQLVSMERYYQELKGNLLKLPPGAILNVTGYSLGGHLATVFTVLHTADIQHTYIFNGAGIGRVGGVTPVLTEEIRIKQLIDAMDAKFVEFDPAGNLTRSGSPANVQTLSWYQPAVIQVAAQFQTTGTASLPTGGLFGGITRTDGAFNKITQLFGAGVTGDDVQFVANSGIHGPVQSVLIEGQPLIESIPLLQESIYGNAHSITLIVDSLALQELFQTIDSALTQTQIETILKSASAAQADRFAIPGEEHTAEGDTLEKALNGLRKVFIDAGAPSTGFNDDTGGFGDLTFRNEFYTHLAEVKTQLATTFAGQAFHIRSLVGQPVNDVRTAAEGTEPTSFAYRFALKELTPFVVLGSTDPTTQALYDRQNATGELSLVNPDTGIGEFTSQFLIDRALFLAEKIAVNSYAASLFNTTHFHDNPSGYDITPLPGLTRRQLLFGDGTHEVMTGGTGSDHFYGGSGDDQLSGLENRDYLEGNRGDDTLDGGSGADTMLGGQGNDTYLVDNVGDVVREYANSGIDLVRSSVTFTLDSQVENLTLTGTEAIDGSGSELNNLIIGNDKANRLEGQAGQDTLRGGIGNDILAGGIGDHDLLEGGAGFDTYIYNAGDGIDQIEDSDATGKIVFNGGLLQGGVSTDDGATYVSLDGTETYVLSGGHLIVNGVLTINADFQSGQFGIQLEDLSDLPSDPGAPMGPFPIGDANFGDADADYFSLLGNPFGPGALYGNGGDDALNAWATSADITDLLDGGPGDDTLIGGAGRDYLIGGEGADFGNMSDGDIFVGGDGNDIAVGDTDIANFVVTNIGNGAYYADGGDGADTLLGALGGDVLHGGAGDDTLRGENRPAGWTARIVDFDGFYRVFSMAAYFSPTGAADVLFGEAGNDLLVGDGGDDILSGGADNDQLFGDDETGYLVVPGDDILDGGAGDDLLVAGDGTDSLSGGAGIDTLFGDKGDDVLDGGDDADTMLGGDGADELFGGGGNDLLFGDGLNNQFVAGTVGGDDVLDGGDGDDELQGGVGADMLSGGAGNDLILGQDDDDTLFGDEGDDELQGGDGIDLLGGDAGDDLLLGDAGDDELFGDAGHDQLGGNDGNDLLLGGVGNDILEGGKGNDVLVGGAGNDVYNFSLGDGQDTITDTALAGEGNVINFSSGITLNSLTFNHDQATQVLAIQVGGGTDSITFLGFDPNTFRYAVNALRFFDGSSVALADQLPLPGGFIEGTDESNVIRAGSSNDAIFAGAGNDVVNAGAGNDVLVGGAGADTLQGGAGQDTYVFSSGDGEDIVSDTAGEGNRLVFGAGMTSSAITLGRGAGNTLEIRGQLSGDRLEVGALVPGASPIDTFEFADGTVLTFDQFIARGIDIEGTTGSDIVFGTSFIDRISAGGGDDVVRGGDGNDVLNGEAGNDALEGEAGDDVLVGGTGDDQLLGGAGNDTYRFNLGDGIDSISDSIDVGEPNRVVFGPGITSSSVTLTTNFGQILVRLGAAFEGMTIGANSGDALGFHAVDHFEFSDGTILTYSELVARGFDIDGTEFDDVLSGSNVIDRFRGGLGNDHMEGGEGNDSYFFNVGDGVDTIVDAASAGAGNEIDFGPGIISSDLRLDLAPDQSDQNLKDLLIRVGTTGDAIQLDTFDRNNVFGPRSVESFRFADGSTLTYDQLLARGFDLTGTDGDDQLDGTNVADRMVGDDGADVLRSGLSDDQLDGGAGDDRLVGGQGNDTYLFGPGSGQDAIVEFQGSLDKISMAAGVAPSDVVVSRNINDLVFSLNGGAGRLTVSLYFVAPPLQIEQVLFADGTVWDQAFIENLTRPAVHGTGGNDVLVGTSEEDQLFGLAGNDQLSGLAGNDLLDGGTGADTLTGGTGNDTYVIDAAGDVVIEALNEGIDTIQSSVTSTLATNAENLTLTGTGAINGTGNELDNVLTGNSAANALAGGLGHDTYVVGTGDTIVESAGEGTDTVEAATSTTLGANLENLTLTGSASLAGTGNSLDNVLKADGSISVLTGGAGNDAYLIGPNDDDDILVETAAGGIDTVITAHDYRLPDHIENLTLFDPRIPNFGSFSLLSYQLSDATVAGWGSNLNNTLIGGRANNALDGGLGSDRMIGGEGNDTYVVDHPNDLVIEQAGEGTDTVQSSITYALSTNVEVLNLTGTASVNGTGNALNNDVRGNEAPNMLEGGAGDDSLQGGGGADTYLFVRGTGSDIVFDLSVGGEVDTIQLASDVTPADIEVYRRDFNLNLVITGTTDELTLASFFDRPEYAQKQVRFADGTVWNEAELRARVLDGGPLFGTTGNDTLSGGAGHRMLIGNYGNDVLIGGDWDDVLDGDAYLIGLQQAFGDDTLIGGAGDDTLIDSRGTNLFDGGVGNDSLALGTGVDTVLFSRGSGVDSVTLDNNGYDIDIIQLAAGISPADVVITRRSSALSNIVDLRIPDSGDQVSVVLSTDILAVGPETTQAVVRFADGTQWSLAWATPDLAFTETPPGPSGDNTYFVGVGSEPIVELPGEGTDTVQSLMDYSLDAGVENLILAESRSSVIPNPASGTGNELDNLIIGNTGDNLLNGGAGNDVLVGGLFRSVESLFVFGTGSDILIGGAGDDVLMADGGNVAFPADGSDGAWLFVGGGSDFLENPPREADDLFIGGVGNDTYILHSQQQTVAEFANEGADTVRSTVSYTLGEHVENLVLVDPAAIYDGDDNLVIPPPLNGTGNDLDNLLIGSGKDNLITGGVGNDTLWGGNAIDIDSGLSMSGNDILAGGLGHDTYIFKVGDEIDTVSDIAFLGEDNRIQFGAGIGQSDLTFTQDQAARTLTIQVGTSGTDQLLLTNFDPTGANGSMVVETLTFADGSTASLAELLGLGGSVNHAPTVATPLPDQTVPEDVPFSLVMPANMFADQDAADVLTLSASLADGTALPSWLDFDAATRMFTGMPDDAQVGSLDLKVTATDTGNLSVSDVFTLTVTNVNEVPTVVSSLANQQATEDTAFSFTVPGSTFVDVDQAHGDTLTNSASLAGGGNLPAWLSFDLLTHTFSGIPLNSEVGSLALTVTATDQDNLSVSTGFTLTIQNVNDAPTVSNPFADQTVLEGAPFTIQVPGDTFADQDVGDVLSYSATLADGSALPIWLSFNGTTRTFAGTPDDAQVGSLDLRVMATDSGNLSVSDVLTLTVINVNEAPTVAAPLADQQATQGSAFNLVVPATMFADEDAGDVLTYTAALADGASLPSWLSFNSVTRTFNGTPQAGDVGAIDVRVTVTDQGNRNATDVFALTIAPSGGTVGNDTLIGTSGNDVLDGLAGDDILRGLVGNDTLLGGAGNDVLDGGLGADAMTGGTGSDTYIVSTGDTVVEAANAGTDTVLSNVSHTLAANVELLMLTGVNAINGAGNSLANGITGNAAANVLDGGVGADVLAGLNGNDTYLVDNAGDLVIELANNGIDQVQSSVTFALGANVEDLNLTGTVAINGTGNGSANVMIGNGSANVLSGAGGADTLRGGLGNDRLNGGSGNDTFLFGRGDGQDLVQDNSGTVDKLLYDGGINPLDLVISRQANNLRLAIHGSTDHVTIQNWYTSSANRTETIQAGKGQTMLSTQVDQLIQAMAGFTAQTGLTWDQAIDQRPQEVQTVLAASWQ